MIDHKELLIVSLTPQNLERGALWFSEHHTSIKKAHYTNSWWRENAFFLEKDFTIAPSELLRKIGDFGYERAVHPQGPGTFAARGGLIEIWPINTEKPFIIEFSGNAISFIHERDHTETKTAPRTRITRNIETLSEGSFVVHEDHGIGIFRGLRKPEGFTPLENTPWLAAGFGDSTLRAQSVIPLANSLTGFTGEYYILEYAPPSPGRAPDRLYVPREKKNRITPYVGFETPRIHRLGGTFWETTKRRVREDIQKLARELLALYARRHEAARPPHQGDTTLEHELRATFSFTETEDQLRAEEEIFRDLLREEPMDRVLCGDVGFGKTEVAIRAALRAIASGTQVAVLAPTTILAAQHEHTFRERLGNLPVNVAMLSRLTAKKDEKKIIQEIGSGAVDCVIGTHRLLARDISFKNLGLVIIDEEQRFGVKQKEHFKKIRISIDILSLSATPIPRTMSLVLARLRAISLLSTPPPERLPIRTFVLPYSKKIVREAIVHEYARGGQLYILHNRIETIEHTKKTLEGILSPLYKKNMPTIGIIHGRMNEQELVRVMDDFREKKIDILIATTIIENGLDISSANTLIVDDATRLGLAQAHQLRGRIGRAATQGYAYFLYRPRHLTEDASRRLDALREFSALGDGYQIALQDLEIRGAGNILGREQSGAINRVGLNLYCQILGDAIDEEKIKTGAEAPVHPVTTETMGVNP